MTRRVAGAAVLIVALTAIVGCARPPAPPAYLCLPGRANDGSSYLLCKALPAGALGSE